MLFRSATFATCTALLAQSVEHFHGKEKVVGSIPTEGSAVSAAEALLFRRRAARRSASAPDATGRNCVIRFWSGDVVSPGSRAGLGPRVRVRLAA